MKNILYLIGYLIFVVFWFWATIYVLRTIPNRVTECEKAGGVMITGMNCIKKDAVIK